MKPRGGYYYTGFNGDEKIGRLGRWKRISRWIRYRKLSITLTLVIVLTLGYIMKYGVPGKMRLMTSFQDQNVMRKGLSVQGKKFQLDGKPFRILSGSIHYFRVPRAYWRDRLSKLKAVGLNTVDTYVAWNMHEEIRGEYDFKGNLDLVEFLNIAHELGLYVILRPGPYICAEWDWGGLPAWLMAADPAMKVRSLNEVYLDGVAKFFTELFRHVAPLQYSNGGPIIAVQIENEYGAYNNEKNYLLWLHQLLTEKIGITELLFTSDGPNDFENGYVPGVLAVVNFNDNTDSALDSLERFQPGKPLMIGEFWPGWFDHWSEKHHVMPAKDMVRRLQPAFKRGASINLYMFHGGTNFGFMNGANLIDPAQRQRSEGVLSRLWDSLINLWPSDSRQSVAFRPTITSYDYDAPLNEFGGKTEKYMQLKELISRYQDDNGSDKNPGVGEKSVLAMDPWTKWRPPAAYGDFDVAGYVLLTEVLDILKPLSIPDLQSPQYVEKISAPEAHLIWYGFVAYRTTIQIENAKKIIIEGVVADRMLVIVNGKTVSTIETGIQNAPVRVPVNLVSEADGDQGKKDIILLVENMGRANYAKMPKKLDNMYKGFEGEVNVENSAGNPIKLDGWKVFSVRFRKPENLNKMVVSASAKSLWKPVDKAVIKQPAFYRVEFDVKDGAMEYADDTFVATKKWGKGVVYANGENLGRYSDKGPQKTLYLPGPWLKKGKKNELIIFELETPSSSIMLQAEPDLGEPCPLPCYV